MFLLDTNVISELRKVQSGRADPGVAQWAAGTRTAELLISVITVQELETGILLKERKDPVQGRVLRGWLEEQVLPTFAGRILPITLEIARQCAALHAPDPRPQRDALIAATALVHRLTLVTRNVQDVQDLNAAVFNPWSE